MDFVVVDTRRQILNQGKKGLLETIDSDLRQAYNPTSHRRMASRLMMTRF